MSGPYTAHAQLWHQRKPTSVPDANLSVPAAMQPRECQCITGRSRDRWRGKRCILDNSPNVLRLGWDGRGVYPVSDGIPAFPVDFLDGKVDPHGQGRPDCEPGADHAHDPAPVRGPDRGSLGHSFEGGCDRAVPAA
eukprot:430584-Rhodomonas_salina.1